LNDVKVLLGLLQKNHVTNLGWLERQWNQVVQLPKGLEEFAGAVIFAWAVINCQAKNLASIVAQMPFVSD